MRAVWVVEVRELAENSRTGWVLGGFCSASWADCIRAARQSAKTPVRLGREFRVVKYVPAKPKKRSTATADQIAAMRVVPAEKRATRAGSK